MSDTDSSDDDDYHQLEGNYSDDDDDDISVEDDEQGEGHITALASRTNHLINSYRDYIAEMSSDPLSSGGDAAAAAAMGNAVMESDETNNNDAMSIEEGTPTTKTTTTTANAPPGTKGFIQRFQDERKGATIYRDFNYKDDPLHCNLHNTQYHHGDNNDNVSSTFFATYDDSHDIPPHSNRRRQYHYSMFRSPTFRKCVLGLLTFATIIGICVEIVKSQQQKKDLPDWEGMLAEEVEVTTGSNNVAVGAGGGAGEGAVTTVTERQPSNKQPHDDSNSAYEIQIMYQNSAMKYHPIYFSREQGYQGQTYDAAMSYCASQMGGLIMCPYEAICPAGADMLPLGGVKSGTAPNGATWIPFIDEMNAWAQIGSSGKLCDKHNGAPRWGITGEGNESITRYVACCQANSPSSNQVEEEFISQMQMQKYNPQWFDRTSGWEGETHNEAISFCARKGKMTICPYDAYCPEGANNPPYGGVKVGFDGEQEQWAPMMNKSNDWVQIGPNNKCKTKGQIQQDSHGLTFAQEGSKVVSQHLLCCNIVEDEKDGH